MDELKKEASAVEEAVEDSVEVAKEAIGEATTEAKKSKAKARRAAKKAAEKVEETLEQVEDAVEETRAKAQEALQEKADATEAKAEEVKDELDAVVSELHAEAEEKVETVKETVEKAQEEVTAKVEAVKKTTKAPQKVSTKYVSENAKMWRGIALGLLGLILVAGIALFFFNRQDKSPILTGKSPMSVDGTEVSNAYFTQQLKTMVDSYGMYYGYETMTDPTMFSSLVSYVAESVKSQYVMYNWAVERGHAPLTEEQMADVEATLEEFRSSYETEEEFQEILEKNYLTEDLYHFILEMDKATMDLQDELYDVERSPFTPDDADVPDLAEAFGIYTAKHILFELPTDATDEQREEIKARAEEVLARVQAGEDFDTLMQEYNEDPGMAENPDGYTFANGEFVTQFYETAANLEEGAVSGLVESNYGFHIIKRLPLNVAAAKERVLMELVYEQYTNRVDSAHVKLATGFDKIAFSDLGIEIPVEEEVEETTETEQAAG